MVSKIESSNKKLFWLSAAVMAFTAGFVDTCGFVALFGLFTAHVTGNFVLIGASMAKNMPGVAAKLLAFPVFIIAVAATRVFLMRRERARRPAARALLVVQSLFLGAFLGLGVWASPIQHADDTLAIAAGMAGVVAMAIQNVASRSVFSALAPTTVMTGNVTQIVMDLVEWPRASDRAAIVARMKRLTPPVVAFGIGAIAGGLGVLWFGLWCLICPLVLVILLAGFQCSDGT